MCLRSTLNNQLELTSSTLFDTQLELTSSEMGSPRKMFLNYFLFHWDFIDYNVNACMYCLEILVLTYSDFTFDNVNFDLRKRSGFK